MITLIVLFGSYLALYILARMGILFSTKTNRELAVYALALFMFFFGLSHFYKQDELVLMLPQIIPLKEMIVFITGMIEIALAIGLLFSSTRRWAGIILAMYLVAVFPANIFKAMNEIDITGTLSSPVMSWVRLAFQPLFIVWALYCSKTQGLKMNNKVQSKG